jgi:hypothetical protein
MHVTCTYTALAVSTEDIWLLIPTVCFTWVDLLPGAAEALDYVTAAIGEHLAGEPAAAESPAARV